MSDSRRSLLAVLAHPDDESYGMGGTLARYSREGVDVHVAIATDGAAGSIDPRWQGDRSRLAEARAGELRRATDVLGAQLHILGYRDSGYIGDPAGEHPLAWINADKSEAVGRVVALIRELRPDVLVTHDETGGYYHPDHIQCCTIVTAAFHAAADPAQYPQIGPEPFQPDRFYYSAFSNSWVRFLILYMRLKRQDPRRAGRNQDIDYTRIGLPPEMITTTIDYRAYWDVKMAAGAQHGSQGGGTSFSRMFPTWLQKRFFGQETYIRVYPPLPRGQKEKGFFAQPAGRGKR
jgi:LmbE family N-acetylglucosaminyl deacetylase